MLALDVTNHRENVIQVRTHPAKAPSHASTVALVCTHFLKPPTYVILAHEEDIKRIRKLTSVILLTLDTIKRGTPHKSSARQESSATVEQPFATAAKLVIFKMSPVRQPAKIVPKAGQTKFPSPQHVQSVFPEDTLNSKRPSSAIHAQKDGCKKVPADGTALYLRMETLLEEMDPQR